MGRMSRAVVIACVALSGLGLWYVLFVRELGVTAPDLHLTTSEDVPAALQLGSIERDENGYTVVIVEHPGNGTIAKQGDHYLYTPDRDYHGKDRFSYTLNAGRRSSAPGVVEIEITPVNDKPTLEHKTYETREDTQVAIYVQANDRDNDPLTYQILSYPQHGSISGELPDITYQPHLNYHGTDRFTVQVSDGILNSEPALIEVTVTPVNDPPLAIAQEFTVYENTPLSFLLKAEDPDGDTIQYEIVKSPEHGQIRTGSETGDYLYIPRKNVTGSDSLLFKARDHSLESEVTAVQFTVVRINRDIDLDDLLTKTLKNGGVAVGSHLKPEHVFRSGRYIPASILKLATAASALSLLGGDYRFKTEIYVDSQHNLYLKGYGDPTLTAKEWHEIARVLQNKGLFERDVNALIIDTRVFSDRLEVDGRRQSIHYYDAPPSALPTNYNIAAIQIRKNRKITMMDDYTPLTSLVKQKSKHLPVGYQHFNVALNTIESIRYSGELVGDIFKEYGALFNDSVYGGRVPEGLKPVVVFNSELTLKEAVRLMLRDSNNFIANQLILIMAYEAKGEGVGIAVGAQIVAGFLREKIGLSQSDFNLVEGSGLSTNNSIDLLAMLKIINYFKRHRELLPHLSLSRYPDLARSGRRWNILAKSGTLSNTSTLAGFIQVAKDEWKPFVIMLNDDGRERGKIMEIIGRYYNG